MGLVFGPEIIARTLSIASVTDTHGNRWQYHSRSDRHTTVAACGMLLDFFAASPDLQHQVRSGVIGFDLHCDLSDSKSGKKKSIDLVLRKGPVTPGRSDELAQHFRHYGVQVTDDAKPTFVALATMTRVRSGPIVAAFEVKAAMTAHVRALPRLYDELDASHIVIHGAAPDAVALGLLLVNTSARFTSPDKNRHDHRLLPAVVSRHKQPLDSNRVVSKAREVRLRTPTSAIGYDAFGVMPIDCANDGSTAKLVELANRNDPLAYDTMIQRAAAIYAERFGAI